LWGWGVTKGTFGVIHDEGGNWPRPVGYKKRRRKKSEKSASIYSLITRSPQTEKLSGNGQLAKEGGRP